MSKILGKTLIGNPDISFIDAALISVPNTTIINRALIRNLAADMGPRMGVERFMLQQLSLLQNEVGPSNEIVWKAFNDDRDLTRFVGNWTAAPGSNGIAIQANTSGDFLEICFYGTGLNALELPQSSGGWTDYTYVLDGASQSNLTNPASSTFLSARGYAQNRVRPIVSGLSVGIHTVKLTVGSGLGGFFGFEILNEASTIRVNSGTLIKDQRRFGLDTAQALAYKPASLTGAKGGRVILYNSGNQIQSAVQAVAVSQGNLGSADHSLEEVVRTHFYREFGAGRTNDDFSTSIAANFNRAFTMDDGTTTLVGNGIQNGGGPTSTFDALVISNSATPNLEFFTLTFVGTGLDIIWATDATASRASNVFIDGTSVGSIGASGTVQNATTQKIVSGLPYGTHTVKFGNSANNNSHGFIAFKIYQPKKPSIPSGAVELADYNVMADFVANTTVSIINISTGVLRKHALRELVYTGTWDVGSLNTTSIGGWATHTATATNYFEYTFFGTGFDLRTDTTGALTGVTISIDGSTNLSGFTTSQYSGSGGGIVASTGVWTIGNASLDGAGVVVSGLTLGKHTVRVTNNSALNFYVMSMDIITPIHSPKANTAIDLQNTLLVGSCALSDSRQTVLSNQGAAKAWAQAVGIAVSPSTSSTTAVPMPDMSTTIKTNGGPLQINFYSCFNQSTGSSIFQIYVDGIGLPTLYRNNGASTGSGIPTSGEAMIQVAPGIHKVDLYWYATSGTTTADGTNRILTVKEQ